MIISVYPSGTRVQIKNLNFDFQHNNQPTLRSHSPIMAPVNAHPEHHNLFSRKLSIGNNADHEQPRSHGIGGSGNIRTSSILTMI
jgi:hypothetical protein